MADEDRDKTLWCGNLEPQVTEELLYELFLQAGPLERVKIAKDRNGRNRNYAFVTYRQRVSVPYAINLFQGTRLFGKTLKLQARGTMAALPPPIRSTGILNLRNTEPNIEQSISNIDTTKKIKIDNTNPIPVDPKNNETEDNLATSSSQGSSGDMRSDIQQPSTSQGSAPEEDSNKDVYNITSYASSVERERDNTPRRE